MLCSEHFRTYASPLLHVQLPCETPEVLVTSAGIELVLSRLFGLPSEVDANLLAQEYFRKALEVKDRRLLLSTVPKGQNLINSAMLGMHTAMQNGVAEKLLAKIRVLPEADEPADNAPVDGDASPADSDVSAPRAAAEASESVGSGDSWVPGAPSLEAAVPFEPPALLEDAGLVKESEGEEEKPDVNETSGMSDGHSELEDMSDVQYEGGRQCEMESPAGT